FSKFSNYEEELKIKDADLVSIFNSDNIEYIKQHNVYCTEVTVDKDNEISKTIAMLQTEGSLRKPYFYLLGLDKSTNKYKLLFESDEKTLYPVTENGKSYFFEQVINFDTKVLEGCNLYILSKKNKNYAFEKIEAAKVERNYNLSKEDKKWLSVDDIEKITKFDYSALAYKENHPAMIETKIGDKTIKAKLFHTSVSYLPSNYTIKVYQDDLEIFNSFEGEWGFKLLKNNDKNYLVYIGMGKNGVNPRVGSMSEFLITVIDLDTMGKIYESYVDSDIKYIRQF
nr:hypothetical protein [Treponema sp.]